MTKTFHLQQVVAVLGLLVVLSGLPALAAGDNGRALAPSGLVLALDVGQASSTDASWMSVEDMRSEFIGKTLEGVYPDGSAWSDAYFPDGSIIYHDTVNNWTGEWSFKGPAYCTWYLGGAQGGCFLVRKLSANCYSFFVVPNDWNRPEPPDASQIGWNGNGWVNDRPGTCEPRVGV